MATVAELRRENEQLRAQLAQLAASSSVQLDRLIAANAELTAQVARLNDRVTELLAVARRRQRPPTPPPLPTPPPPLDAPTARAFADRPLPPPVPEKPQAGAEAAAPHGPQGAAAPPRGRASRAAP